MTTLKTAKLQAKRLRAALGDQAIDMGHGQCLELVAKLHGFRDWNTLNGVWPDPLRPIPKGWFQSGDAQEAYEFGAEPDPDTPDKMLACIRLRSGTTAQAGFGTLMQTVKAEDFLDTRVRLSAKLRLASTNGATTLWMRADNANRQSVAFDNMESRAQDGALQGTAGWVDRQIVLDIPRTASTISFGFYLRGDGIAHCADMAMEIVGTDVAVSSDTQNPHNRPANLSFSE